LDHCRIRAALKLLIRPVRDQDSLCAFALRVWPFGVLRILSRNVSSSVPC
jgi:hypothetical protein